MINSPLVSVIMNCYNSEAYLKEAIDSVYAQTYPNWEIIFWDNASTDNSASIAQEYDARLKYFRGNETVALGAARNKALAKATGEFIAFLDCDDVWMPEKLEKQIPLFLSDDKVVLVYSDVIYFNLEGQQKQFFKNKATPVGYCFSELLTNYFLTLSTSVIRYNALITQPYWFMEELKLSEEAELFLRLAYSGKLVVAHEILAKYRIHKESLSFKECDLFFSEMEIILDNFRNIYADFDVKFKDELNVLRIKQLRRKALYYLFSGEKRAARKMLYPHLYNRTILSTLIFTWFPIWLAEYVRKWKTARIN